MATQLTEFNMLLTVECLQFPVIIYDITTRKKTDSLTVYQHFYASKFLTCSSISLYAEIH